MPSNDKRRDAARRQLARERAERQQRDASRRRLTLIVSVVATVVVVVVAIVLAVTLTGNSSPRATGGSDPAQASSAGGPGVTFDGVTVSGATVLAVAPTVSTHYTADPTQLEYKDLVVGTGTAATDTSQVHAQYVGVVYKTGKIFDSSWADSGAPVGFTLGPGNVIDGFTQGLGGTAAIPAMKVGGRRLLIMPASLAYQNDPPSGSGIPDGAALVFVVDLTSVTS